MWWKRKQHDFNAEIEAHLQLEADQLRAEGLAPAEAQAAARRGFGNRTAAGERFYESSRWMLWDHLVRDVRFAVRAMRKDAAFSALAILGLALGIGLSTAIFALIDAVVVSETATVRDPASYVGLYGVVNGRPRDSLSYSDYRYYQDRAAAFRTVEAESGRQPFILGPLSKAGKGSEAEDVEGRFVSAGFLSASGLKPALGRSFSAEEERVGGAGVTLLNFEFWKRRFAADAGILGKTVVLNAHALTVIGIADARYGATDRSGFYLPLTLQPVLLGRGDWLHDPHEHWLYVGARLRPGVTARQAQAEIDVLSSALRRARPADPADGGVFVSPGGALPGKVRSLAALALAVVIAVSMILLIACSNLANLLLARAIVRGREIGVRLSLGASRSRLISQLLTESMLLAGGGGALGLLFSYWLARSLVVLMGAPAGYVPGLDYRVVLYGIVLSLGSGLSFGLGPALAATRTNLAQALHAEGLSGTTRSQSQKIWSARNVLVIVPLALSLMLLIGAGVSVRYIQRIYLSGPALDTSRLIRMSFPLNAQGYDEAGTRQFQENLRRRIVSMPGVASVALAGGMPLFGQMGRAPLLTEGLAGGATSSPVSYNVVSDGFFGTAGVPIVHGRAFSTSDRESGPPVAIVSQSLARTYWPNREPIGKRLRLVAASAAATGTYFEVIGIARDLQDPAGPVDSAPPTVYVPYGQGKLFLSGVRTEAPPYQMQFLIRTGGEPQRLKAALRREALAADPSLRANIQTLEEMLESWIGEIKTTSMLLSALGALALVMASVGIYAILAYAVSQRTREIGIRMALGAQRGEIMALIVQRSVTLIACGIGLGLAGALAMNRVFSSTLAKLGELDAATCIAVAGLLGAVALLASYLPARKALRVDPAIALRCE
jgi:predicted permease